MEQTYCVYITTYSGTHLPKRYIGSSTTTRISKGYRGSVRSTKWQTLWDKELKEHPELFNVEILSTHHTREEALEEELRIQRLYNVVRSSDWVNEGYAQVKGYAGRDVSGSNNPMYGQGQKQQEWCKSNPKAVSERNRKAAITQWSNKETRQHRIECMNGKSKTRKTLTEQEFNKLQLQKSQKSAMITCDKIEYNGVIYYGWRDLLEKTKVTKHLYRKYYLKGINPLDYKRNSGPIL